MRHALNRFLQAAGGRRIMPRILLFISVGAIVSQSGAGAAAADGTASVEVDLTWAKQCFPPLGNRCVTSMGSYVACGTVMAGGVSLIEQDGMPDSVLRVLVGGVTSGGAVQVTIDDDAPLPGRVGQCLSAGCFADFFVTESILARMKAGQSLIIEASEADGRRTKRVVRLAGFPEAHAGPPEQPSQGDLQRKLQRLASNGGTPAGRQVGRSECPVGVC
jgi:invasion protein IalB